MLITNKLKTENFDNFDLIKFYQIEESNENLWFLWNYSTNSTMLANNWAANKKDEKNSKLAGWPAKLPINETNYLIIITYKPLIEKTSANFLTHPGSSKMDKSSVLTCITKKRKSQPVSCIMQLRDVKRTAAKQLSGSATQTQNRNGRQSSVYSSSSHTEL